MSCASRYDASMRWLALAVLLLGGCASRVPLPPLPPLPPASPARVETPPAVASGLPHYRCDGGDAFDVRFGDGSVELLFANREVEMLLRDAGGTSPAHTVYSSTRLKAQFGLDPAGRGAQLNFSAPPVQTRCVRD